MNLPKPIRYDHDTWLCVRSEPAVPKALIRRIRDRNGVETYLVVRWDLNPANQTVMASTNTLEKANGLVQFEKSSTGREKSPGYPSALSSMQPTKAAGPDPGRRP